MSLILVVDDSSVDRRMVGGLLDKDPALCVDYAEDGAQALASIERARPDLVLTDLQMPGIDGLELTAAIRKLHAGLPVVLMTSKGSEDTAFRALRAGAASYVPKAKLCDELLDTLQGILRPLTEERNQTRLLEHLSDSGERFTLPNETSLISSLVGYLQRRVTRMGICNEADQVRIGIALEEALVNALFHGNLEISSEVREQDRSVYCALVRERRALAPYKDRRVHVAADLSRGQATFTIRDEGPGFNPGDVADPREADLDKITGRGLLLMKTFMDEVSFNASGNQVTMVKRSA